MTPRGRKVALFAHATSSAGWIGAVAVFFVIAVIALVSKDALAVRGAYLVMEPAAWRVLVPLAVASLVSGLVLSLGTPYMSTFRSMAGKAADPAIDLDAVRDSSPVVHAALAMLLLLTANVLAVYKPLGLTAYGLRTPREGGQRYGGITPQPATPWERYAVAVIIGLFGLVVLWHLAGGGLHRLHGN